MLALDPKTGTYEYYNSQGGDLNNETRTIEGIDLPANEFLKKYILENPSFNGWTPKFNPNKQQTDHVSCGVFICRFMKLRHLFTFEEYCNQEIQIDKERTILAVELGNDPL
jgi:hypothetical protein